jgi:predicted dehydrogenase
LLEKKHLSIGIIGMGKMGLLHASIVNTIPGARLSAIYDTNSIMVKFTEKALNGISVTDNLDEFSTLGLDAVYVTTPIPTHSGVIRDIYSRGIAKNIFVEKTLAYSYEEAEQLCQRAKTFGGVDMVGFMSRFTPTFKKAKVLLQEEAIGQLASFKAYAYASDFVGVRSKSLPARGGAIRDLGAHIIDLSLWLFGNLEVDPSKADFPTQDDNSSRACFKVRGCKSLTGEFDISWCKEGYRLPEFGLTVNGSKGSLTVSADFVKLAKSDADLHTWHRHDLESDIPFFLGGSEYYREDKHFINSILKGGFAEPDFNIASKVDNLITRVEQEKGI